MSENVVQEDEEIADNISMGGDIMNIEDMIDGDLHQFNNEENIQNLEENRSIQEEDWTEVRRGKKRKTEKINISISSKENILPKQFALARLFLAENIVGIHRVKYVNAFKVIVSFDDEYDAEKLISCQSFQEKGWRIQNTYEVNMSYGLIRDIDIDLPDSELLECIKSCNTECQVLSVKRLKRRIPESGWQQCESVRICFKGSSLPPVIKIFNLRVAVEPYVFPVTQCSRCWRFGHSIKLCPSLKIFCPKCGQNHTNCETTTFKCINCKGNHMSLIRSCPAYLKEKKIRELMAEFNCTYKRALSMYVPPFSPRPTVEPSAESGNVNKSAFSNSLQQDSPILQISYASAVKKSQRSPEVTQSFQRVVQDVPTKRKQRDSPDITAYEDEESSLPRSRGAADNDRPAHLEPYITIITEDITETDCNIDDDRSRHRDNSTIADNTGTERCDNNRGESSDARKDNKSLSYLMDKIKDILFCKRLKCSEKIKSVISLFLEWCVSAFIDTFAEMEIMNKQIRQNTLDKLWCKQTGAVQILLSILENSRDNITSSYITSILRDVLCLKQGKGKKCSANNLARQQCCQHFISLNGTQVMLRALLTTHSKRDGNVNTELMQQDIVWTLAALAPKDGKFAIKVRMLGCVRTMHLILKGHLTDNKIIFPLLVIMKQLSKNAVTTSILVRDGVVATYDRLLGSMGFIPTARLRLCLDAIDYFSKNKVCCMQIVKTGLCSVLLRVFDKWDRYEGRMRLKICAHILQTLKHVCNIKSGRRALCTKKHVQTLHRFCSQCPDEPEFDGLLARVCSVISLCLRHQALPVPANSPAVFNLDPIIKGTNTSWPCLEDDDDGANSDAKSVNSDIDDDGQDTDDYLSSNASFEESDSKTDEISKIEKNTKESIQSALWINSNERDLEDLKKYFIFFKEFGSHNRQLKFVKGRSNSKGSILEDFLASQSSSRRSSPSLSYASGAGNIEFESAMLLHMPSFLTGYNKIQESSSTSNSSLKIHKDIPRYSTFENTYTIIASRVKSIIPFVKVAYPDMNGGQGLNIPEPLNKMDRAAYRNKLLSSVDRAINPEAYMNDVVVYDLDVLCSGTQTDSTSQKSLNTESNRLSNSDEQEILRVNTFCPRLSFESRFESGNLRKAIQVGQREYELILMPDVNSNKRHQWFYFEVRNMQPGRPYVFNIINCEKSDSQFNFGMKPLLYSVKEAVLGRPGWVRAGTDICYYRNSYHSANQKNYSKCYLTVTFTIDFPHANDVCYLAYHFPYTYSMMMTQLWQWSSQLPSGVYFRVEPLCYSLNGNEVPVITLTTEDTPTNPIIDREIVFLTSRVHPGESNASWVMDGTLGRALADTPAARALRSKYIFKIVPMLNVEGVINGCHRCGLTNEDLNRRWCKPSLVLHPTIYHTKGLIEYLVRVWRRPPLVYCDYHGHSRKKNVFFYGCAGAESWCSTDRLRHDDPVKYLMLPALMHRISPAFALGSCAFRIGREREGTARVAVWRHLNVPASYTMEASFCGFDRGPYKGFHLSTRHLQEVGGDFCEALSCLADSSASVDVQFTKDLHGEIEADSEGSAADSVLKTDSDEDFD